MPEGSRKDKAFGTSWAYPEEATDFRVYTSCFLLQVVLNKPDDQLTRTRARRAGLPRHVAVTRHQALGHGGSGAGPRGLVRESHEVFIIKLIPQRTQRFVSVHSNIGACVGSPPKKNQPHLTLKQEPPDWAESAVPPKSQK